MSSESQRTALLVMTPPEADQTLIAWRRRFHAEAVGRGLPAHLTVLYPFVPVAELTPGLEAELRSLYASVPSFAYALTHVRSFPDCAWLEPEPSEPFRRLIATTCARFPDYPPYGDRDFEPVPHCTVGKTGERHLLVQILGTLERELAPRLPIHCRADAVSIFREGDDGCWVEHAAYPLGHAA